MQPAIRGTSGNPSNCVAVVASVATRIFSAEYLPLDVYAIVSSIRSTRVLKVIGLIRDKMADSEVERNTTHLRLLKSRHAGATGNAGSLYYDAKEHRLVPLDDWLEANGSEF